MRSRGLTLALLFAPLSCLPLAAQETQADLGNSTLEEVANAKILISSVSRKEEDVDSAAAAVFVITKEEIARSSANSIPDLLRGVPGIQVAQLTASTWAVTARGFNSAFANKLLVLIDGRTVYSELYSGVHWDEIDLPLENIDRIEIIRGPGAAVWGVNAVNGVIHIITRPARELDGSSASGEYSKVLGTTLLQQGGSLGDRVQYRGFAHYLDRRALVDNTGARTFDGMSLLRGGGRVDYQRSASQAFSILGDLYRGHLRQQVGPFLALALEHGGMEHDSLSGGFIQGAWLVTKGRVANNVQAYFTDSTRHELATTTIARALNVDIVSHLRTKSRVDLVWGGDARHTHDVTRGEAATQKPVYNNYLVSAFFQADFVLKPKVLVATLGTKLQNGTLTGLQLEPSTRLMWTVNDRASLWTAVSRAVVAPSLQDKAIDIPLDLGTYQGLPVIGTLLGNWEFKPEEVVATELGYRQHLQRSLSADLALYVNRNRRLQSLTTGTATVVMTPTPHIAVDELYTNGFSAWSQGVEAAVSWRPANQLQMRAAYTWMEAQVKQVAEGQVHLIDSFASPRNTVAGDVFWAMSRKWSISASAQHVGNTPLTTSVVSKSDSGLVTFVPAFTRLDIGIRRKLGGGTVVQAGGTNLLQPRHLEFGSETSFVLPHDVPRSLFVRAAWSF